MLNPHAFARLTRDVSVVIAIAVSALAALEVALRWRAPERIDRSAYELHSEFLYGMKAGIAREFVREPVNGGGVIVWRSNRDGFRGPELDPEFSGPTIIVYGDSNIQARFSDYEHSFPALLERNLGQVRGPAPRVLNAGVVGFGPDQSYLRMKSEIERYAPSVVVLHVFADNDFGDLVRNQLFDVADGELIARTPRDDIARSTIFRERTFRQRIAGLLVVQTVRELLGQRVREPTEGGSSGPIDKRRYRDRILAAAAAEFASYVSAGAPTVEDHYDIDVAIDPNGDAARTKAALMQAVLREAREVSENRGAELFVVIQPSTVDLTQNLDYLSYDELVEFPEYDRTRLSSLVAEICADEGIAHINLFEPFSDNDPAGLYFRGRDNHWNEAGQRLAARLVAESITPLLSAAATP